MKLIYIGNEYYWESGSVMSSLYQEIDEMVFVRSDWGKVELALRAGENVAIRPAYVHELRQFENQIHELKKQRSAP